MNLSQGQFKNDVTQEVAQSKSSTGWEGCSQKGGVPHPKYVYIYISLTQFFLLCISCDFDNMTKKINKNISKVLSVPLR